MILSFVKSAILLFLQNEALFGCIYITSVAGPQQNRAQSKGQRTQKQALGQTPWKTSDFRASGNSGGWGILTSMLPRTHCYYKTIKQQQKHRPRAKEPVNLLSLFYSGLMC